MKKPGSRRRWWWHRAGVPVAVGSALLLMGNVAVGQAPAATSNWQRCGTAGREIRLQQRSADRPRQLFELNRRLAEQAMFNGANLRTAAPDAGAATLFRIPVVVHVVHGQADGRIGGTGNGNITDAQIRSQIEVLNEDYRRRAGTPGGVNPNSTDVGVEFFLATTDPQGAATNGITRHYYAQKSEFDVYDSDDDLLLSQISYWPSDRYLNVWVTSLANNYLGYGQYPTAGDTLQGLEGLQNERTDGVYIDYHVFGRGTGELTDADYNLGRTTTHEVGHWLGLIHTWGDGDGCNEDFVADTPLTKSPHNVRNCNQTFSECIPGRRTRDQIENYMDYSPDRCMNLFTAGQTARMRAVLQLSPRRVRLVNGVAAPPETETLTLRIAPNPANTEATAEVTFRGLQSFQVELFDMTGRLVQALPPYENTVSSRVSVPVKGLPKGLYVLRVRTDSQTTSQRLLVQ